MATRQENLQSALNNIAALIKDLTALPRPTYSVDGKSYSWSDYLSMLITQQEALQKALVNAGGPYEVNTRGVI